MRTWSESSFAPATFHEDDQLQLTALALSGLAGIKALLAPRGSSRHSEKEKEST
jgi:hypothetical protein